MKKFLFKFCPICRYYLKSTKVDGKKRLVCQKCGWINYRNPIPSVACVVKNRNNQVLIIRRNVEPGMDKWALPGGFIDSGENPQKACLRELKEETGIEGKIERLVGIYIQKCKVYGSTLVIGYEVRLIKGDIVINNEIKEAKFVSREDLPKIPFLSHREIIEEVKNNL